MSTNHNRIRVADLETNDPNKILKTNQNGELEFSDANNLKAESYNALDCTIEGKTLDARQGKVLKDMIDNKTVNLATDAETQINTAVSEDNKVVSRSKLFNWWQWVKSQTQTISGMWNFTNKVTLTSGTNTNPPLILPNGTLTNVPQDGAIERDSFGKLFTTRKNVRYRLLEDDGNAILLVYNSPSSVLTEVYAGVNTSSSSKTVASQIGAFPNSGFLSLKMFNRISLAKNTGTVMPNTVKLEVFIQINNGFFYKTIGGARWNQLKIYDKSNLSIPTGNNITFYDSVFSEVIETNLQSWSGITLPLKTDNGSNSSTEYTDYSITNANNDAPLPASEASFNFLFTMTLGYADSTNVAGQNVSWKITNLNKAIYIEKIR